MELWNPKHFFRGMRGRQRLYSHRNIALNILFFEIIILSFFFELDYLRLKNYKEEIIRFFKVFFFLQMLILRYVVFILILHFFKLSLCFPVTYNWNRCLCDTGSGLFFPSQSESLSACQPFCIFMLAFCGGRGF